MKKYTVSKMGISLVVFVLMALFSVSSVYAVQSAVNLGTAGDFVILSKSGISTTGATSIVGDMGVSPIDSTAITGFGLVMDSSNLFARSSLVTGKLYAADYTGSTPAKITTAISDMETAYTDAAGRTLPDATELGAGDISAMTIAPGLYKWGTGVLIDNRGVTLSGGADDVWIFQIGQDLTVGNGAIVTLSGGAQTKNIFWQVGGQATLGTTSKFKGNILSQTLIEMRTGATLNGRALAHTAVTLDANAVTMPTPIRPVTPTPDPNGDSAVNWQCGEWSGCSSNGIRTKTCTQQNGTAISTKKGPCTPITPAQANSGNGNPQVENKINQGIGPVLSGQISVRKEEIKSGNYVVSLGQLLRVKELTQDLKELRVNNVTAQTTLNITAETDPEGKTKLKTKLNNGQKREIKIMPNTASERALERLGLKVCSSENNCTIQLKTVESGDTEKIQYEMYLEKNSKILRIFQKKMLVIVDVNAETGETTVHKPIWAFMATESAD